MANWWMPIAQLRVMRRIERGGVLLRNTKHGFYYWFGSEDPRPTSSAKALYRKGLICSCELHSKTVDCEVMRLTPTGKNELGYNRHREID
ncbi:hypothetical protein JGY68_002137 [Salmonella enterica]|nr:hypothetical protein [Salmonella enterica]EGH5309438.1 hypothetical protein [Salmonella enterica]EGW8385394.1 hypothetical protein [Salmonella enterica]EHL2428939.1 hypothetical protein [Salmonella enterica]EHO4317630.1 hypothetical protein [Salmonella enterica]